MQSHRSLWPQRPHARVDEKLLLAICLYKDEVTSYCSHWPSTHPERSSGWRSGMEHSVVWEKLAEQAFRELDIFQKILGALFLTSSRIYKSTKITNRDICSSWLAATFCQNVCLTTHIPLCPPKSHIYWPPLLPSEQFLRAIWEAISWAMVLIFAPNKT